MEGSREYSVKPEDQRIIFLNSFLPRTGHNFSAEVFKIFTNHQVLAHNRSETRLSTLLNAYSSIKQSNFHDSDRKFLDSLFVEGLRDKILSKSDHQYIMIKDTSFVGVDQLPKIFPEDFHFLLTRDPKNVFISLLKGMNLTRKSIKNRIKKIGTPAGLYPYFYSRKVSSQVLKNFPDLEKHIIIKYEDLVRKDEKTLLFLKKLFKTEKTLKKIREEIDAIQVINTSFYKETGAKNIWDKKPKTSAFNPLNRKSFNFFILKAVELGSRRLRKKMNYV